MCELRLPGEDLVAEDEGQDLVDLVVELRGAGQPGARRRHRVGRQAVSRRTVRRPRLPAIIRQKVNLCLLRMVELPFPLFSQGICNAYEA